MDPAQAVVHAALFRQDAMNAVIDRGDSPIQQFYSDATVFVTGGSGFLGKQLIEKLFRSCEIKKMYMLIRCKKGRSIDARKKYILSDPLFETLRMKKPDFADRIILVEGDVGSLKLGLDTDCWKTLTKEVDTIFHVAATVKFDASLQTATLINVRGTREIIELAKQCINIKCLVYMSTAFSQATKNNIGKEVLEQLYTTPIRPKTMIKMAASMEKIQLDGITNSLIDGWPNTYTFTKALAEELINTTATDFPVCIVRPPIVLSSYTEPSPGWIDYNALYGPSGLVLGGALGFLHVLKIDVDNYFAIAPVDYVNNCAIAAGWDAKQKRQTGDTTVSIYNISNSKHFSKWKFIAAKIKESIKYYATPKAIWYCYMLETNNIVLYTLLAWLLHYIPAYVIDMVCTVTGKRPKGLKSFVDVYGRVDKSVAIFSYFTCNTWHFRNHNVETMISKMNKADQAIFNCDLNNIDPGEFIKLWYISIRKYIIKDGLKDSNVANAKQNRLRILNYLLLVIYFTLLFYFVYFLFSSIRIVLSILCY